MSIRALWLASQGSDGSPLARADLEAALAAFGGLDSAFLLGGPAARWRILLVEPEQSASEDLALHLAARTGRDVVRVATRWSSVTIARWTPAGPGPRRSWPPPPAAPDRPDRGEAIEGGPFLLLEEVVEEEAKALGLDAGLATLGVRALKDLLDTAPPAPIPAERLTLPPAPPVLTSAVGPGAKAFLAALSRKTRVSALAVVDVEEAPSWSRGQPDGFRARSFPPLLRHGTAAATHLAASAPLIGLGVDEVRARIEQAVGLLEGWAASLPVVQGLVAVADWDPTLQIDQTPWEAAWDAPPVAERAPGWARSALRGFGEAWLLHEDHVRRLGPAPSGLEGRGRVLRIGATPPAEAEAWLAPLFPTARVRAAPEALLRDKRPHASSPHS